MREAVGASETSVSFYETTRPYIPEDIHVDTRYIENLKCHMKFIACIINSLELTGINILETQGTRK
jgi:hypothetical protein